MMDHPARRCLSLRLVPASSIFRPATSHHQVGEPVGGIGGPTARAPLAMAWRAVAAPRAARRFRRQPVRREVALASSKSPPPAFTSTVALASWSWSSACGSGTRIAGRPIAASSATVEAPERATTRWLSAIRVGRSGKNGATSAVDSRGRHRSCATRSTSSARACCTIVSRDHRAGSSRSIAGGTMSAMTRAPWLPPNTVRRTGPGNCGAA